MARNRKQPKQANSIKVSKKPKIAGRFSNAHPTDDKIHFRFRYFDAGFRPTEQAGADCFYTISDKLKHLAIAGWSSVNQNSAHHHEIQLHKLTRDAQKRLRQLTFDDLDGLFSLRLTGKKRIFGVRKDPYFYVVWWDPEHKVCPSVKKGT